MSGTSSDALREISAAMRLRAARSGAKAQLVRSAS
jgi:hypothetical protein